MKRIMIVELLDTNGNRVSFVALTAGVENEFTTNRMVAIGSTPADAGAVITVMLTEQEPPIVAS